MLYKSENSCVYGEHMKHTTRNFATMIKEICREENICVESFLDDRIFQLRKDSMYQYIFDYQFGLNPESVHSICCNEDAVEKIMHSLDIPYIKYCNEAENIYRVIVLDGEIKLIYLMQRPCIIGDGVNHLGSLVLKYFSKDGNDILCADIPNVNFMQILEKGKPFYFNWKHGFEQREKVTIIKDVKMKDRLQNMVQLVAQKMSIRFASVDVVDCGGEYNMLGIDSSVMMEHFSRQDNNSYSIAKEIYREAILKMFLS